MATVRSALRNKSHGLDLDFSDARGKTLLHRVNFTFYMFNYDITFSWQNRTAINNTHKTK
jgi:hypothetical protein